MVTLTRVCRQRARRSKKKTEQMFSVCWGQSWAKLISHATCSGDKGTHLRFTAHLPAPHPSSRLGFVQLTPEDPSRCPLRSLLLALGSNNSLRVSLWSFLLPTYDSCQPTFCALLIITTGGAALQSYLFCCSLYILQLSFQQNKNFSVTITM